MFHRPEHYRDVLESTTREDRGPSDVGAMDWRTTLENALEHSGLSRSALARRMGMNRSVVSNVLNGHGGLSVEPFVSWLEICGYEIRPRPSATQAAARDRLAELPDHDLDLLLELASVLPVLDEQARGMLRAQIGFWESSVGLQPTQ